MRTFNSHNTTCSQLKQVKFSLNFGLSLFYQTACRGHYSTGLERKTKPVYHPCCRACSFKHTVKLVFEDTPALNPLKHTHEEKLMLVVIYHWATYIHRGNYFSPSRWLRLIKRVVCQEMFGHFDSSDCFKNDGWCRTRQPVLLTMSCCFDTEIS